MVSKKKENKYIKFVKSILRNLNNLRVRRYSSKYSKRTYSNYAHIILLALRQQMDKSYREFIEIIQLCSKILELLNISKVPHFTTLQKATKRFKISFLERIMSGFIFLTMTFYVRAGIDATGFQSTRASSHYTKMLKKDKNSRRKIRNYIKLSTLVDLSKKLIISQKIRRSPAHDNKDFNPVVDKGKDVLKEANKEIISFDADKGYDAEENHRKVVEDLHAEDRIKLKNKDNPCYRTSGFYRRKAKKRINRLRANYRSGNENVFSVLKRVNGSTIRSFGVGMQNREMLFKEIAYNATRIINHIIGFLQSLFP